MLSEKIMWRQPPSAVWTGRSPAAPTPAAV